MRNDVREWIDSVIPEPHTFRELVILARLSGRTFIIHEKANSPKRFVKMLQKDLPHSTHAGMVCIRSKGDISTLVGNGRASGYSHHTLKELGVKSY